MRWRSWQLRQRLLAVQEPRSSSAAVLMQVHCLTQPQAQAQVSRAEEPAQQPRRPLRQLRLRRRTTQLLSRRNRA